MLSDELPRLCCQQSMIVCLSTLTSEEREAREPLEHGMNESVQPAHDHDYELAFVGLRSTGWGAMWWTRKRRSGTGSFSSGSDRCCHLMHVAQKRGVPGWLDSRHCQAHTLSNHPKEETAGLEAHGTQMEHSSHGQDP